MAYRSIIGNQFKSELKEVSLAGNFKLIQEECSDIRLNPLKPTEPLVGNLAIPGLRYRKIITTTPQYRIMFMTYECGYYKSEEDAFCEHDKCPVGTESQDEDSGGAESEESDYWQKKLGLERQNEPTLSEPCEGLIKFAVFGTRELINNLYKLRKKDFQKFLKV